MPEYIKLKDVLHILDLVITDDSIKHTGKAIRKRLKELPVEASPKWISVKERLPEDNVRVLVWLKENDSYTRIDTDRITRSSVTFWVRWGKYVTHWCPIPESLKEGAEE